MSFLVCRLLKEWLSVDEMLIRRGIPLASRCVCYKQSETMHHVFFSNQVADQIRAYFAGLARIKHVKFSSGQQFIMAKYWTREQKLIDKLGAQVEVQKRKLPQLCCWEKPLQGKVKLKIKNGS
ncbi:hypothetical protein LIER_28886 [Lithospermum erythrorhizon]|uniref:Reverse transcriptase zinc-binding domain-containing protein n=1 Tax=Lithospermum erythrorhizon TaxID=34254 RepID=A0AAV3RHA4_LITER